MSILKFDAYTRLNPHEDLLKRLQHIHDGSQPFEWISKLKSLAKEFNLEVKI